MVERDIFIFYRVYRTAIDINMGCPFPLITKKCKGAGILTYPDKVKAILDILDNFEEISFSLKIRSGMNESSECMQLADIINESRIDYVTMHPRTGIQQYKGLADRTVYKDFADRCSKPMIYNGDIKTIDDIKSIEDITPNTKGVMIGRGLLENPALAMEYNEGKRKPNKKDVPTLAADNARLKQELEYSIKDQHDVFQLYQKTERERLSLQEDANTLRELRKQAPDKLREALATAEQRKAVKRSSPFRSSGNGWSK